MVKVLFLWFIFGFIKKRFFNNEIESDFKAVLITGCDSGFGHLLAKLLDTKGFLVYACCLFPNGLGASELRKNTSNNLKIIPLDVTKESDIEKTVEFVKNSLGLFELWAVVNNAGIHKGFTVELTSFSDFKDCMEVNAFGQLRVIQGFLPLLRQSKGRIVNVISNAGRIPVPHLTPYCMSKFAAAGLNDCLRQELAPLGVSVISVEPEMFKTPLTNKEKINKCYEANLTAAKVDVRASYDENYMNRIKKLKDAYLYFTSPSVHLVIQDLESAICLHYPDLVYKTRQNIYSRIFQNIYEVSPAVFQDFIYKILYFVIPFFNFRD
ncbi:estradiol 17-beta-dehydrogenase 2 [Nephila pilipes]|uniref:Estradiol 17-beta-dehydrogenase 2 n=1 Tax=Nephila pilipes TaxID=299642 RepID=A0A8X6Q9M8_NEPPI|nr:estradiol 17-beta-dehydrogenase 2 [Nephila pilipes]